MRTIKRKRIFGGRKSLHKRKHKKSLKKVRGGAPEYLFKSPGILGVFKTEPLYTFSDSGDVDPVEAPDSSNLFKGNIKNENGMVILSDYKERKSVKIGWIYGSRFGNIVIYSKDETNLGEIIGSLNNIYLNKGTQITNTLFIPKISDGLTNLIVPERTDKNELTPWNNKMDHEIEIEKADEINADIDTTFKNILVKYFLDKIAGITKDKIEGLLEKIVVAPDFNNLNDDIKKKYENKIKIRNIKLTEKFDTSKSLEGEKWEENVEDAVKKDIYEKINILRLKQDIYCNELIEIFSEYESNGLKITIPFNINYFKMNITEDIPFQNFLNKFIEHVEGRGNKEILKFNNYCWKSLSKILYSLKLLGHVPNKIYKGSNIVTYNNIIPAELNSASVLLNEFKPEDSAKKTYRDFMNNYFINSLIHPKLMANLLVFYVQVRATIMFTCGCNTNGDGTISLTKVLPKTKDGIYKYIGEDESRPSIISLETDNIKITKSSMIPKGGGAADPPELAQFAEALNPGGEIKCELEVVNEGVSAPFSIDCKYGYYYKKDEEITDRGVANVYLYLYDDLIIGDGEAIPLIMNYDLDDGLYKEAAKEAYIDKLLKGLLEKGGAPGWIHNLYELIF